MSLPMTPERLEEIRATVMPSNYLSIPVRMSRELLAEVDRLQAKLDKHAAWAAERIEMNENKS